MVGGHLQHGFVRKRFLRLVDEVVLINIDSLADWKAFMLNNTNLVSQWHFTYEVISSDVIINWNRNEKTKELLFIGPKGYSNLQLWKPFEGE